MSKYSVNQTVLREEKYLVEALKEMGYEVEVHPEGAQLNSYYSEQEAKVANIIIIRKCVHIGTDSRTQLSRRDSRKYY
jgi:fructose-specific phosphotransferase system component IIB